MKSTIKTIGILIFMMGIVFSFAACDSGSSEITVEQAFHDVRKNFRNPEIDSWIENGKVQMAFNFHEESFNQQKLNAVIAYWDSLPRDGTFYGGPGKDGYDENTDAIRFKLILLDRNDNRYLEIEIQYPVNGKVATDGLGLVVPEKALEITKNIVSRYR